MTTPTPGLAAPSLTPRRPGVDLFLVSFLVLFLELACIRWFGATVVFLTFFTNIVLMACFLGMTVGCLTATRKANLLNLVGPLLLVATGLGLLVLWAYFRLSHLMFDVGSQQSPQLIYFGTEYRAHDPSRFVVPIEAVAGLFFVLVALVFVGLGQVMGRAFDALPNRVGAYLVNILGSLAGIVGFGLMSYCETRPVWWFIVALALVLWFLPRQTWWQSAAALVVVGVAGVGSYYSADGGELLWSPYYKVRYRATDGDISTNNIAHQQMVAVEKDGAAYSLPHLLARDSGLPPFKDVLIIGAGSGNDVAAALAFGAEHIDAVEIDPAIQRLGKRYHPDQPYSDPRITVHLDDGRSFIKHAARNARRYDLVIYALVDSLVLHSGYSSLRLESFLFTQEAFADIKATLKPDGVFAMYNYYRQGWVVGRLVKMARQEIGSEPLVMSMPYQAEIRADLDQANIITFILTSNGPANETVVDRLRAKFAASGYYWLNADPRHNSDPKYYGHGRSTFGPDRPAPVTPNPELPADQAEWRSAWLQIGPAKVQTAADPEAWRSDPQRRATIEAANRALDSLPSDNWPFLYLREARIPALNLRGMAVIAALSLALLFLFAPRTSLKPSGRMFFLGAGFMLLETKGVVHMALLFGSTWVVNSVVFFAILVMIALANLLVLAVRPRRLWPYYLLLLAALLVNVLVPMNVFLALPGAARTIASCAVIFVPVFFAGIIFAASFRDSVHPDRDLGWNIAGVVAGGLSEFLSLVVGFNLLLVLAIAFYALSAVLGRRRVALPGAG